MASEPCPPCTHNCNQGRDCSAGKKETIRKSSGWWIMPAALIGAMIWAALFAAAIAYPAEVTVPEDGAGVVLILEEGVS